MADEAPPVEAPPAEEVPAVAAEEAAADGAAADAAPAEEKPADFDEAMKEVGIEDAPAEAAAEETPIGGEGEQAARTDEEKAEIAGEGAAVQDAESAPVPEPPATTNEDEERQAAAEAAVERVYDEALIDDEEEEVEEGPDPAEELAERLEELTASINTLKQDNGALQKKVVQYKALQKNDYSHSAEGEGEGQARVTEHKYLNVLSHVHHIRMRLRQQQVRSARISDELKSQLEDKRARAIECRDSFRDFKRMVSRNAEYSRTGKKIAPKVLQEIEDFELEKDAEVEEVRGSNISLKNRLSKLETALRKKDELADNLHVIDFEQLKIENQTLNEKIEERNEELHKLRKKTITTVQIVTHMREKLQFIQHDNNILKSELGLLEQDLIQKRDTVAGVKRERDELKSDNVRSRQASGVGAGMQGAVTKDFDDRAERIAEMKEGIAVNSENIKQRTAYIQRVHALTAGQG